MTTKKDMAVVLMGNLTDGFVVKGPFKDFDEANEWAYGEPDIWVMVLETPEDDWAREDES